MTASRAYALRRLLLMPVTWLALATITFALLHLTPGGPVETRLAEWRAESTSANAIDAVAARRNLAHAYGFDAPLTTRYRRWIAGWLHGDWGLSLRYGRPVREMVASRARLTFFLGASALALAYLCGIPLGAWLAHRPERWRVEGARGLLLVLQAMPPMLLALLLTRSLGAAAGLWPAAICHASTIVTGIAFLTREAFIDEKKRGYVTALRARGLSERAIFAQLLPRAVAPLLAGLPQTLTWLAAGSVLVETIFDLPGLGRLSYESSVARDYPVLLAILLILGSLQIGLQGLVDILLSKLDPRLRFSAWERRSEGA